MERYWRLIAVVLIVSATVGVFYIQSAIATNELPDITVETVEGDKGELEPVTLNGSYSFGHASGHKIWSGIGESFRLDSEDTTYNREQSFFERFGNGMYMTQVNDLQKKYRGFMRGKSGRIASYLVTEDRIAYADVINQSVPGKGKMEFDIAVLNKENEDTTSFTVPVPNRAMYHQVYVEDVQLTEDNQVQIITRNFLKDGLTELHLYRFDVERQDVAGEDTILSEEKQDENQRVNVSVISGSDVTAAHDEIIFRRTTEPEIRETDPDRITESAVGEQEYIAYNPENAESRILELPESIADQDIADRDNTSLYFISNQQIVQYDLETEQINNEIEIPSYEGGEFGAFTQITNDKVYMLTRDQQPPQRLIIVDLKTGDELFEGKIKPEDSLQKNATLEIYDFYIE